MADTSELREKIAAVIDNDAVIYEGGLYPVHVANTRDLATRILALPGLQAEAQAPAVTPQNTRIAELEAMNRSLAECLRAADRTIAHWINEACTLATTPAPAPVDAPNVYHVSSAQELAAVLDEITAPTQESKP